MPGGQRVGIPVAMVRESDGEMLRVAVAGAGVWVSLGFNPVEIEVADVLTDFTSRGPRANDCLLKPDVVAPGYGIISAKAGAGDQSADGWGTSMASPHGAGALAVVRELHPDWTVEELKALLMNTAAPVSTGLSPSAPPAPLSMVGAGRIDLRAAVGAQAVAFATEPEGAVSLSFGLVDVLRSESWRRTVTVANKGSEAMRFSVSITSASGSVRGMAFRVPGAHSFVVVPEGEHTLDVELDAWSLRYVSHACDPGAAGAVPVKSFFPGVELPFGPMPMARHCVSEHTGFLVLEPMAPHDQHPALRVPLYAVVRRVSDMRSAVDRITLNTQRTVFDLPLVGVDIRSGAPGSGKFSLVSAFELVETSPDEGVTAPEFNFWDLAQVGVASNVLSNQLFGWGLAESVVSFAVVTHAPWAHPSQVEVNVRIDTDRDGTFEHTLENLPLIRWDSVPGDDLADHPRWADVPWVLLRQGSQAAWQMPVSGFAANRADILVLNSDVMVLSVRAEDLGLTEGASRFDFRIEVVNRAFDLVMDSTAVHTYDAARPGLALSTALPDFMYWYDWDGVPIPVEYDREAYLANGSEGLLLIHHHNASGARAEVVNIVVGPSDSGDEPFPVEVE